MIVQPDFLDHWKTQLLTDALEDPTAPLMVLRLWGHCQQRRTGTFENLSALALRAICRAAAHDAEKLRAAIIDAGFVRIEGRNTVVHQWESQNAALLKSWENGRKGGRPKKASPRNPEETHGLPVGNPDETDKRREEKIRGDQNKQSLADPRSAPVTAGFYEAYEAEFGAKYAHTGGKDGTALKKLLSTLNADDYPPEKIVHVARAAMARSKEPFAKACKQAATLHGFCHTFNEVRAELNHTRQANGHSHQQPARATNYAF